MDCLYLYFNDFCWKVLKGPDLKVIRFLCDGHIRKRYLLCHIMI